MTTNSSEPLKLFYCYAHEDKTLRDELDAHLSGMKRQGFMQVWYDREIRAGQEWEHEIDKNLSTADIILLLVSVRFLASDYCYGIEMQKALQRHEAGTARVVPIILRPVDWEDAPFSKLQILPTEAKHVTRWPDPNDAFEDIAKDLRKVVKDLRAAPKTKEDWVNEGVDFDNLKRYEETLDACTQAIQLEPNFMLAYYTKGCALYNLNQYEEAIVAFDHAIRLDPNFAIPYIFKGFALQHLNRSREAQIAFAKAKQLGYQR